MLTGPRFNALHNISARPITLNSIIIFILTTMMPPHTRSQQQAGNDAPPASQSSQSTATMQPHTRSQRLAHAQASNDASPASQSSQSTVQDSTVEVRLNWILLDKSHHFPVKISIPLAHDLYDKPSGHCRGLFSQRLSKEYRVSAEAEDIVFWTVGGTSFSRFVASELL